MRIHTLEQLIDFVDADLAWRKKELSCFKKTVDKAELRHEKALLRGAIAILYAHWEGFIKNTAEAYLSFVADQGLRYSEGCNRLPATMNKQ